MSKNSQKNQSEINLGNQTYERGFNDGLNGRPKTIKKSHRHAHRYHIGYKAGQAEHSTTMRAALATDALLVRTVSYPEAASSGVSPVAELIDRMDVKRRKGFWRRFLDWFAN